jgi:hypothetical protein
VYARLHQFSVCRAVSFARARIVGGDARGHKTNNNVINYIRERERGTRTMPKAIEHVHWPDALPPIRAVLSKSTRPLSSIEIAFAKLKRSWRFA